MKKKINKNFPIINLIKLKNDKDDEIKIYKQNLELSRTKLSSMKSEIDDLNLMLSSEKNNVRSLQLRVIKLFFQISFLFFLN